MTKVHFVRATGEAVIMAKPDRAQITIGVVNRAATAAAASAQNASESSKVIESIKRIIGSKGQVTTSSYSLSPQYDYAPNHQPKLNGYQASNAVLVTIDDFSVLGKVIDESTASGANEINGISFMLKDDGEVRAQAMAEAAKKARGNAEALAKALNVRVTGLLEAEPTEVPVVRPMMAMAMAKQVSTPIEAGNLDIRATVRVTMEVQ